MRNASTSHENGLLYNTIMLTTKTTALLLIDFQRDFCEKGGYADKISGGTAWVKPILPNAKKILDFARKNKILVVHTREGYSPNLSDCDPYKLARSKRAGAKIGSKGPMGRLLIRGEYGHDFIDLLRPAKGETVIDKSAYGAFTGTNLLKILKSHKIHSLVICGVTADVCVHTTVRQAVELGFFSYYVKDAISTPDQSLRRACEKMISVEGGVWGKLVATREIMKSK